MEQKNQVVVDPNKGACSFQVAGQDVKLSYQIVRDFLTKGNGSVTDQDLTQFISLCKYNQLNPFLNEAYLVKFGSAPAQIIVSKEAFLKRADACPDYDGMQGGVIVQHGEEIKELEGCFIKSGEKLVGGWAKIYRKDKKYPIVARVNLEEYDKKQSIWNDKKSTMIAKVAKVQALREAFPAQLGAMYTREEQIIQDADFEELKPEKALDFKPEKEQPKPEEKPGEHLESEHLEKPITEPENADDLFRK